MTIDYKCPCCNVLLQLVGTTQCAGTIDMHFECMTCAHMIAMVVNVPDEPQFLPRHQWYDTTLRGIKL